MASEWPIRSLGDVLNFANGKTSPARTSDGKFLVFGSNGAIGRSDLKNSLENTIVIGRVGSYCGSTFFSKAECWVTDNAIRANAKEGNDAIFAYYLLQTLALNERRAGSGQPLLNQSILCSIDVAVPPLGEQRTIAKILGAVDDRIENLRQTNNTLEAIAQALFKSWFVDFDPVRAKAEGRQPEGMDAATADLFPDTFKTSRLGLIPEGWEVSNLDDQLEILSGGTPRTKIPEYWDGDIPWFSVVDAPKEGQVFVFDTERRITQSGLENSPARLLPANTTIISARGTVGKLAVTGQPMAMNQSCYGLRPANGVGKFSTYFSVQRFVTHLQQIAHGAVFDTITRSSFSQAQAVNAPKDVVSAFERLVGPLMEQIHANGRQAITLSQLRDTLLPRLISGKLRLPEAECEIEAATA